MKRYKKVIPISLILLIALSISSYRAFSKEYFQNHQEEFVNNSNKYSASNVVINKKIGNNNQISLKADNIVYQKRNSDFFDYQNLKEIYIENAEIDIYNDFPLNKQDKDLSYINKLIDSIDVFCSYQSPIKTNTRNKKSDAETELLSRIIFKNINLKFLYPNNKIISLQASNAEINYNIDNIVFNDHVIMKDYNGKEYNAKIAVFSERFKGFYFPEGFITKRYKTNKKQFYVINNFGHILHSHNIPEINYIDLLSKKERDLFIKIVNKLPPQLRLMLGLSNV